MKIAFMIMILTFVGSNAFALGQNISFQGVTNQNGVALIEYRYGFAGRRVIYDDDGQASLVALLAVLKAKYFEDQSPSGSMNVTGWSELGYESAFRAASGRLIGFYQEAGVCNHSNTSISGICTELNRLRRVLSQNSVTYQDVFQLSDFIQSLSGAGIQHSYDVDRYDSEDEPISRPEKRNADYFFGTDNLTVYLPDRESGARCKDAFSQQQGFLGQLAAANGTQGSPSHGGGSGGTSVQE